MNLKNVGTSAKFIVGAATAVLTGMEPYFGHRLWFPSLTAGLGALMIYLVPNTPSPAVETAPKAMEQTR